MLGARLVGEISSELTDTAHASSDDMYVRFSLLLNRLMELSLSIKKCCDSTYKELTDTLPYFMELGKDFISDYKQRYGELPFMPASNITYANKGLNLAVGAYDIPEFPLLPTDKNGSSVYKFNYASRFLLANSSVDPTLEYMPGAKQIHQSYSNNADRNSNVSLNEYANTVKTMVKLARFNSDGQVYETILGGVLFRAVQKDNVIAAAAADPAFVAVTHNGAAPPAPATPQQLAQYFIESYADMEDLQTIIIDVENSIVRNNKEKVAGYVSGFGANDNRSRSDLRIQNILELGIVPLNVHAFMKEVAFTNLLNYAHTFDEYVHSFVLPSYIKNMNDDDGDRQNTLIKMDTPVNSPRELFVKLLVHPWAVLATGTTPNKEYYALLASLYNGHHGMKFGRPRFLSDQLFHKVLLTSSAQIADTKNSIANNLRKYSADVGGPAAYEAVRNTIAFSRDRLPINLTLRNLREPNSLIASAQGRTLSQLLNNETNILPPNWLDITVLDNVTDNSISLSERMKDSDNASSKYVQNIICFGNPDNTAGLNYGINNPVNMTIEKFIKFITIAGATDAVFTGAGGPLDDIKNSYTVGLDRTMVVGTANVNASHQDGANGICLENSVFAPMRPFVSYKHGQFAHNINGLIRCLTEDVGIVPNTQEKFDKLLKHLNDLGDSLYNINYTWPTEIKDAVGLLGARNNANYAALDLKLNDDPRLIVPAVGAGGPQPLLEALAVVIANVRNLSQNVRNILKYLSVSYIRRGVVAPFVATLLDNDNNLMDKLYCRNLNGLPLNDNFLRSAFSHANAGFRYYVKEHVDMQRRQGIMEDDNKMAPIDDEWFIASSPVVTEGLKYYGKSANDQKKKVWKTYDTPSPSGKVLYCAELGRARFDTKFVRNISWIVSIQLLMRVVMLNHLAWIDTPVVDKIAVLQSEITDYQNNDDYNADDYTGVSYDLF
jgi:hypothetical protein